MHSIQDMINSNCKSCYSINVSVETVKAKGYCIDLKISCIF